MTSTPIDFNCTTSIFLQLDLARLFFTLDRHRHPWIFFSWVQMYRTIKTTDHKPASASSFGMYEDDDHI